MIMPVDVNLHPIEFQILAKVNGSSSIAQPFNAIINCRSEIKFLKETPKPYFPLKWQCNKPHN